jgi:hypothetical protein
LMQLTWGWGESGANWLPGSSATTIDGYRSTWQVPIVTWAIWGPSERFRRGSVDPGRHIASRFSRAPVGQLFPFEQGWPLSPGENFAPPPVQIRTGRLGVGPILEGLGGTNAPGAAGPGVGGSVPGVVLLGRDEPSRCGQQDFQRGRLGLGRRAPERHDGGQVAYRSRNQRAPSSRSVMIKA